MKSPCKACDQISFQGPIIQIGTWNQFYFLILGCKFYKQPELLDGCQICFAEVAVLLQSFSTW